MEQLRLTMVSEVEEEEVPERDADAEFVEQIKSDSANAPSVEDTMTETEEGGESDD